MKSLQALGLVLLIIGGMVIVGVTSLRPLGGALAICGAGLVIFGWVGPRARSKRHKKEPYRYEDDGTREPQPIYQAQPSAVRLRERPGESEVGFTSPNPGSIPPPRQNQPAAGAAEYSTGRGEVPSPRERERGTAEYTAPITPRAVEDAAPPPLTASSHLGEAVPADHDPYLPPMAPPPNIGASNQ